MNKLAITLAVLPVFVIEQSEKHFQRDLVAVLSCVLCANPFRGWIKSLFKLKIILRLKKILLKKNILR